MPVKRLLSILIFVCATGVNAQNLTVYRSKLSVEETTLKIEKIIKEKDLIFFETVHHHEIAAERGISIEKSNVILFEDPDLTSRLIECEKTVALDLPLKIIVWEESGDVYIGFIDPQLMRRRFLIKGCEDILAQMTALILRITNETLRGS